MIKLIRCKTGGPVRGAQYHLIKHVGFGQTNAMSVQLVGEMELQSEDVQLPDGTVRLQKSTVYIKKCRYLEQSGCVGMCVNMCKVRGGTQ